MLISKINYFIDDNSFLLSYKKNQAYVENYTNIPKITSAVIRIDHPEGYLLIIGQGLLITRLTFNSILIKGVIKKIELR